MSLFRASPFLAVVSLELLLAGFLAASHRMIAGHDGFHYFALQYYFMNGAAASGEIPQWIPFMAQGMPATWWYAIQAAPWQAALLQAAGLFKGLDLLPLFYAGIFWDTLLLLTGTWLLARLLFSSRWTAFFVTVTVAGSAIWTSQPWFNFHSTYALPLALYLGHRFLETGRWRYLLISGNLLALQTLGNLPYFLSVASLAFFLYFLFYALFNLKEVGPQLKKIRWGWPSTATFLLIGASFLAVFLLLRTDVDQTLQYNIGRNPDGTTPFDLFLSYGSSQQAAKWIELLLRAPLALDYTLYVGLLTLPLIFLFPLSASRRKALPLAACALFFLFFSQGSLVLARIGYDLWPFMKFYRHLGLTACWAKLFLALLAGAGFEVLFVERTRRALPLGLGLALGSLALALFILARNEALWAELIPRIFSGQEWQAFAPILQGDRLASLIQGSGWISLLAALVVTGAWLGRGTRSLWIALALTLQVADLYGYKLADALLKTVPLTGTERQLTQLQEVPFAQRRLPLEGNKTQRVQDFVRLPPFRTIVGIVNLFLFADEPGSSFRIDYWQRPLDQLMRAYWGQPIHDRSVKPAGLIPWRGLDFPLRHPAAAKVAGVTEDKIRFFSDAHGIETEEEMARLMTDGGYAGDLLLILPREGRVPGLKPGTPQPLSTDERLGLGLEVTRFDSNHLEFFVTVPGTEPAWAFYSDVWHPNWRAAVNGKLVPVFRANLAYKAVPLEAGENRVHFFFESKRLTWAYRFFGANALVWVVGVLGLAGRLIWAGSPANKEAKS